MQLQESVYSCRLHCGLPCCSIALYSVLHKRAFSSVALLSVRFQQTFAQSRDFTFSSLKIQDAFAVTEPRAAAHENIPPPPSNHGSVTGLICLRCGRSYAPAATRYVCDC